MRTRVEGLAISEHQRPNHRSWRDLSKWRLLFGLAFAPVLPIVLGAMILLVLGGGMVFLPLGWILAAAETWSMLIGTIFLIVARLRGGVRRAHCLLLGAFLAFTLPLAVFAASKAVDRVFGTTPSAEDMDDDLGVSFHGPSDSALIALLGLVLVPFGTLGGWVFWRVGVYPARPKVVDVAPVFD
jgi:hypothetical protein